MTDASAPTSTAFRYMTRFRCIGPECEASCCNTWSITIDREHYERTKQAMRSTPATRQEFDEKVQRVKGPTRSKDRYALIVLNENTCGFFTAGRLCGLQERYGEEVLGDTCAQYPRLVSVSGSRWELSGTASCPEVARQLLLHGDALELDAVPESMLSRRHLKQRLADHPDTPYTRYHDELRNLVLDLLSDPRFDLGTRLSLVAYFADRTRPFLHRGVPTLDEAQLSAEVDRILDPGQRALLAQEFAGITPTPTMALRIALSFVLQRTSAPLFEALRPAVLRAYAPSLQSDVVEAEDVERVGQEILHNYRVQKVRLARLAPRIDQSLSNFAKNFWVRNWYFTAPDLLAHTMELLVTLTVLRFLVLGHPLLAEVDEASPEAQEMQLDRALVDAVFRFSRSFEHMPAYLERMRKKLQEGKLVSLAHAVSLALF